MIQEFLDEIAADIPDGVAAFLEIPFGEIPEIAMPESKDAAVIACGKLAAIMNNALLKPFSGLTPIEVLMRIGQKNAVHIAAMLAGLEAISGSGGKLTIISPTAGGVFPNWLADGFICSGQGIASVSVSIGETSLSLSESNGKWSGNLPTPLETGKHTAVFTATFSDDSTTSKSIEFETTSAIEIVSTFPENETSYRSEEVTHLSVELTSETAAEMSTMTADVFGQTFTLVKSGATFAAEIGSIAAEWIQLNQMTVRNAAGEILDTLTFIITPPEAE